MFLIAGERTADQHKAGVWKLWFNPSGCFEQDVLTFSADLYSPNQADHGIAIQPIARPKCTYGFFGNLGEFISGKTIVQYTNFSASSRMTELVCDRLGNAY